MGGRAWQWNLAETEAFRLDAGAQAGRGLRAHHQLIEKALALAGRKPFMPGRGLQYPEGGWPVRRRKGQMRGLRTPAQRAAPP